MSFTPPSSPPPVAPHGSPRRQTIDGGGILARRWVVRTVIPLTLLLTLGMVSLIYYRWLTVQEPTATIVVIGDPSLDGAEIVLTPGPAGSVMPILNQENDFTTPIHLQPGTYHLMVKLGDRTIFEGDTTAERLTVREIDLPTLLTVTGEPAEDGADIELTAPNQRTDREELDSQNGYSVSWRLYPATYHLTAIRNGVTLYDNPALVIAPHRPATIDLTQPPRHGHD